MNGLCGISKSCEYGLEVLEGSSVTRFNVSAEFDVGSSYSFVYRVKPKRSLAEDDQTAGGHNKLIVVVKYTHSIQKNILKPLRAGASGPGILVKILCLPYFPRNFVRAHFVPRFLHPIFDSHVKSAIFRNRLHIPCPTIKTGDLNKVEMAVQKVAKMCQVEYLLPQVRFTSKFQAIACIVKLNHLLQKYI